MDKNVSEKIKSVLDDLQRKALNAFRLQIREIYARKDYAELIPERRVRATVRAAEANIRQLIADAVSRVSETATSLDAFTLIDAAIYSHLGVLEGVVEDGNGSPLMGNMLKVAADQFVVVRGEMLRGLDMRRSSFGEPKNKGGRPQKWDWEGALIHLVAVANTPDGLSADHGEQNKIESILSDWFIEKIGESPSTSQIRERASKIFNELNKQNKAEN